MRTASIADCAGTSTAGAPGDHGRLMAGRVLRRVLPAAIGIACLAWVVATFDWAQVLLALAQVDIARFLLATVVVIVLIQWVRGVRWLVLLRVPPTRDQAWQALLVNGASTGLATLTPFQAGELVKARLTPAAAAGGQRAGLSAVLLERILDLAGLVAMGLAGWCLQLGRWDWAAGCLLLVPLLGLCLSLVRPGRWLPERFRPYVAAFDRPGPLLAGALLTLPLWGLYALLWWAAAWSMGIFMTIAQTVMLVGAVMLAIIATMVPSGIGVSELASRNVLVLAGMPPADAEGVAIALRLITPVLVVTGSVCAVLLRRRTRVGDKGCDT